MSTIKVYTSSTSSNLKIRNGTDRVKALLSAAGLPEYDPAKSEPRPSGNHFELIFADLITPDERTAVWNASGTKGVYPLVFNGDAYIGTDEELEYANEDGELKQVLKL